MTRTVVVTGATSGIGRAAAREFAGRGDRLVLAARAPETLEQVRRECADAGAADVRVVPTDVTEPGALDALTATAVAGFGRIDVWVHTAAVMAYGRFEEIPAEVFEQVVRTDLLGSAGVARVALRHFKEAGHLPGVNVCLVTPGSVDTPVYQQAANYVGRIGRPPLPITTPERVARAIAHCADKPRREISVGRVNLVMRVGFTALPAVYDVLVGPLMRLGGLTGRPVPPTEGAVFTPNPAGEAVRGGWLPDLSRVVRTVGGATAMVGSAVRRRLS
ncbi:MULTISPECIES: SDR family NAD(P)-dependent oxidoreductase [unclassified Micromonospora]|uniref:SDR family NAD(P)-dependent oxidoreductase n=1 Tax=unclassified Micromonospora TaxID=2617518 RepID=UPI0022CA25C8|nr:SDR family NAD(P)-dependent oxidoreductase [Micromonospora sp. AKA38]GHJ15601.1 short-chain dehydrogenase [Micromonospora sp. AKA38]